MALANVSVTTSATDIVARPSDGNRLLLRWIHVANIGSVTVYLKYDDDSTALTTSNGMPLYPGQVMTLDNDGIKHNYHSGLQGIVASGTCDVRVQYS